MLENFTKIKRAPLIDFPTPLIAMHNMSRKYGIPVYIKRDDLHGIAAAGNKVRKLEYLLEDALDEGASSVVTGGGRQSNHATTTAICAKRYGLNTYLALTEQKALSSQYYERGGNMLLNTLSDAKVKFYPAGVSSNECITHYANELEASEGICPYQIPMGGSNAVGSLGYVRAAIEIAQQLTELSNPPKKLITASGSAGTQAGLIVGFALAKCDIEVIGASVLNDQKTLTRHVLSLCEQLAERLNMENAHWHEKITVIDQFIGEGYGIPSRGTWQAMRVAMETESLILDPCYTAKAFQCLLSLCNQQTQHQTNSGYLFLHTGGVNGLMAYQSQIQDARERGLFDG